ncbi:related to Dicer-like protein 1 [Rhynchosporium agropyri]|uniref:Dicer-like protein 1 n=1 Tax=Rhynchosporium agropyri TaxID=914238 RepID=A0A1E1KDX2_9HELO|nr:related to Dicer-like protein 1 [Rhynchosporium agropyri]
MPFPGYAHDLSQLIEDQDCLIPISPSKPSPPDLSPSAKDFPSSSDSISSIWDELLLLNEGADQIVTAGQKEEIEVSTRVVHTFTPGSEEQTDDIWGLPKTKLSPILTSPGNNDNSNNRTRSLGQQQLLGLFMDHLQRPASRPLPESSLTMTMVSMTSSSPPPPSHDLPSIESQKTELDASSISLNLPLTPISAMAALGINEICEEIDDNRVSVPSVPPVQLYDISKGLDTALPPSEMLKAALAAGCAPSSALNLTLSTTTLSTRTTEEVIADLKRARQHNLVSSEPKHPHKSLTTAQKPSIPEHPTLRRIPVELAELTLAEPDEQEDVFNDDEDDDLDEGVLPVPKQRKITERKRKLNAVAEAHIQRKLLNLNKEAAKSRPQDQQSTRWLVTQAGLERGNILSNPREYQIELFNKAKEKNIIAVLATGSGKTNIALLLLEHTFSQELEDRKGSSMKRIALFLVDSVQLALQQHNVLEQELHGEPIALFCGELSQNLWNKAFWEKNIDENMAIVCTAEVLRHSLHHSFISMSQINLLIFDEAHHAKKDHSYARIIKDFYVPHNPTSRPKIFGMTASPVDSRTDVKKAALELEAILHSEICTAIDTSLLQFETGGSRHEQIAKYDQLRPAHATPLYTQMEERFKTNSVLRKPLIFAHAATEHLGSWCADQIWLFCLEDEETKKLQARTERTHHAKKVAGPLSLLEEQRSQIEEAKNIVNTHVFDPPDYDPATTLTASSNLSSKVVVLIRYLRERFERPTDDKCIVFVNQRYTARVLAKLFTQPHIGTPYLKVGTLVGGKSGDSGDLSLSLRAQLLELTKFRHGQINCLFATSVAEEGLDIPDCNLIIRFDLYTTLIQYIQSRGRARHANSRYIHMYEDGNAEHLQIILEVRKNEGILKRFCESLPEDRLLTGNDIAMDHFLAKEKSQRVYKTSTGAKLTYKMSLMVLANFVDSLEHGNYTNLQPEYIMTIQNKHYVCEVILPGNSPIRGSVGRPCTTKQVAKCSAAFETCLQLVEKKHLDEYLLPTYIKQLPAMRNALLAVDSKKREAYDMKTKPALWSVGGVPDEFFLTVLKLANPEALERLSQPLILLTRSRLPHLPSFFLHFGGGRHSSVDLVSLSKSIQATPELVAKVNTFTLCIFHDVFSKEYATDIPTMPYFLSPASIVGRISVNSDPNSVIAWDALQSVVDYQTEWAEKNPWENLAWKTQPDEFFKDKYIVDPWDGSRKLWTLGVTSDHIPLGPVPPNSAPRTGTRKNNNNIMEYSCSLWEKARKRRIFDPSQRVVEAEYISLRRNLLDEFDTPEAEVHKKCFVILEPLKISPLPSTVVASAYVFPAIIHRLESYLIALEACDLLHLKIKPDLALEACTKDSDNSEDHDAEPVNFQRGMGKNYERLEFLGDCFLKMATSISLFGIHPENDEYSYHVDRMLLICNKNLKTNAMKLKLYEYIRSQSFNRRAWYPEGLVLMRGKTATAPNTHKLGDKSIADVCEAMIGAALLSYHDTKDMDTAVRAVTELVSSENHQVTCFADYYKLYKKPKYQLAPATESQKSLASKLELKHPYHFIYPRLARSAFTHPSYPYSYEKVPSYQRLEFLGDSLLDMVCINFLFHNYPTKDPQWLTEHKMAMVSNQFLGALCVALGFHIHLLLFNTSFKRQISDYVTEISEARLQAENDAVRAGKRPQDCNPDYWVSVRQPPKCLPDIIEAYIGAIFVDSEYSYATTEDFFDRHIRWFFEDMSIYDSFANKHPTTFLTKFLQISMGCADWSVMTREMPTLEVGSKPVIVAMVVVHGKIVADASAESSRYAKVAAAKKAMDILSGLPLQEFREEYACDCKSEDVDGEVAGVVDEEVHGTAV